MAAANFVVITNRGGCALTGTADIDVLFIGLWVKGKQRSFRNWEPMTTDRQRLHNCQFQYLPVKYALNLRKLNYLQKLSAHHTSVMNLLFSLTASKEFEVLCKNYSVQGRLSPQRPWCVPPKMAEWSPNF